MHQEFNNISDELELIATKIVDSAFKVHKAMGPGLVKKYMKSVSAMS